MALHHFIFEVIGMVLFLLMDIPRLVSCAAARWQLPRAHKNVRYAQGPRCFCDIYDSGGDSETCDSVVVFIHGGAWAFGDKWIHADLCRLMRGCPVVAANYSLWPQGDIHAAVREVGDAIGLAPKPTPPSSLLSPPSSLFFSSSSSSSSSYSFTILLLPPA